MEGDDAGGGSPSLRQKVEAILYIAGRPLTLEEIAENAGASKSAVRRALDQLEHEYDEREAAFTVRQLSGERYVMELREELAPIAERVAPEAVLSEEVMRTLSLIAYLQPVKQSVIARVVGKSAYSHIRELEIKGFVTSEPEGTTKMLRTTDYFAEYFGLSKDVGALKRQLRLRAKASIPLKLPS
ncbi:MAG: SMC-Scp complex subunit ScpB [Candidatus Freyarchaeota archaeon]|nr:SMC-Scp complex subunit ScpB [Candidatus Jordarchaeia archaeon]